MSHLIFVSGPRRRWGYCGWSGCVESLCWTAWCEAKTGAGPLSSSQPEAKQRKVLFPVIWSSQCGPSVECTWHQTRPQKSEAINAMPIPTKREDLQRLLGVVTYLSKFISNMFQKSAYEYFYSPLDGMRVHRRDTPSIKFDGANVYTWVERRLVNAKPEPINFRFLASFLTCFWDNTCTPLSIPWSSCLKEIH